MTIIQQIYTAVACNPRRHILDWGKDDLIYYGASNAIVIYDPKEVALTQTLIGHQNTITSVRWFEKGISGCPEILSTSYDKKAILWIKDQTEYIISDILEGHEDTVTIGDSLVLSAFSQLFVTTADDHTIKIWQKDDKDPVRCIQTLSLGTRFASDVRLCLLPSVQVPLLAAGGDTCKVDLYVPDENLFFLRGLSLSGHEMGLNALDFYIAGDSDEVFLASVAKDEYLRIWKISPSKKAATPSGKVVKEIIHVKPHELKVSIKGEIQDFHVTVDSVLYGHEDAIFGVRWNQNVKDGRLQLLTSSFDKTMILWEHDTDSDAWIHKVSVGEVGGTYLGFYGGVFNPSGQTILGYSHHAAFHIWHCNQESGEWKAGVPWGGHSKAVTDLDWEPNGNYLLSCSVDQTTRLHGPWQRSLGQEKRIRWHELARPQIHGYDMACLASISPFCFVSAGEEKVLRAFETTSAFVKNFYNITGIELQAPNLPSPPKLAEGANLPSLGLSNKAVYRQDLDRQKTAPAKDTPFPEIYYVPITLDKPPTEDLLQQNTLWPEIQKLYGHGYELYSVACNHKGNIVASASRGKKKSDCAIILWEVAASSEEGSWKEIGRLEFHTLTITQMAFSPCDRYLLSVSRDRHWGLYEKVPDWSSESGVPPYHLVAYTGKTTTLHSRIIWGCAWSHEGTVFATASRDQTVLIWGKAKEPTGTSTGDFTFRSVPLEMEEAITSIAFAPVFTPNNRYLLALGLESGLIHLYTWKLETGKISDWIHYCTSSAQHGHHKEVTRLKFCPKLSASATSVLLASAGKDHIVRIHEIPLIGL